LTFAYQGAGFSSQIISQELIKENGKTQIQTTNDKQDDVTVEGAECGLRQSFSDTYNWFVNRFIFQCKTG